MSPQFFKNILTVGSGSVIAQLITVGTMPILTRLYTPSAYAGWGLLISVVVLFTAIATLRYELAIVLPKHHEEAANGLIGGLIVTGVMSVVSGSILLFGGALLLGPEFYEELKIWLWFAPALIMVTGIHQACNFWLTRMQEFWFYSLSQVTLPLFTISFQMAAALFGFRSSSGLIIGTLLGQFGVAVFFVFIIFRRHGELFWRSVSLKATQNFLWKYKVYPFYMTPYTIVSAVRDRLVYFLLATFGYKPDIGFYNLSSRVVNMPNSLLSSSVRPVFFQHAASSDFKLLESQINRVLDFLSVCVVPFWILFLFHSQDLFALVFGAPWREAGIYAAILSVPAVPLMLGNWLDRAFDALGQQRLAFTLELVFSLLSIGALTMGMLVYRNGLMAISMQAVVLTFYYSFWLFSLFRVAGYRKQSLLRLLLFIVGIASISALVSGFFSNIFSTIPAIICNGLVALLATSCYCLRKWRSMRRQLA
jgi:O-antigen/teichoic acid export membrane protein